MGILRLWLAISVFIFHKAPGSLPFLESFTAIQVFFVLSGFYMALVLDQKYRSKKNGIRNFYLNRALRIYPIYWIILCITLFIDKNALDVFFSNQFFHNLTIIGSTDAINPFASPLPFIVLQAWTLEVEGIFYLTAPLLTKKSTKLLITLIFVSFLSRLITYRLHWFGINDIDNRFFLNQLVFFLLGIISYRLYRFSKHVIAHKLALISVSALLVSTLVQSALHLSWLYIFIVFFTIPFLFYLSKDNKYDRMIGNLAYPFYLIHVPLIWAFPSLSLIKTLLLSLFLAVSLLIVVEKPLNAIRK